MNHTNDSALKLLGELRRETTAENILERKTERKKSEHYRMALQHIADYTYFDPKGKKATVAMIKGGIRIKVPLAMFIEDVIEHGEKL